VETKYNAETRGGTPYTLDHHVQWDFATPILHVINNCKFYNYFTRSIKPLLAYFVYFFEIFIYCHFCSNCISWMFVILVRNNIFYTKQRSSNLVTIFYYVIDTMHIYSRKKKIKFWPILVMCITKITFFFLPHVVVNFYNGVISPCAEIKIVYVANLSWNC